MSSRRFAAALLLIVLVPILAGCMAPPEAPPCDAERLVARGVAALDDVAARDGGLPAHPAADADPRTTAWGLLAAGLARRTGQEGGFEATPHVAYLKRHLDDMLVGTSPIDSPANNLSLARAALQAWGTPADGVLIQDPAHPDARTLEEAWEARYDPAAGRYGVRLNEHLFGAFAAWLFEPAGDRLHAMADHTATTLTENASADPTARDAWWAAYARAALGPKPENKSLAERLETILDAHQEGDGGVRGFANAKRPDASTTAAALLAWQRAGEDEDGAHAAPAIGWLCGLQRDDGLIPFNADQPILLSKTTSEVVIAVSLMLQPVPWAAQDEAA